MLTELALTNFKSHRATRIALGRLQVFVGPNGVGKTSALEALELLAAAAQGIRPSAAEARPLRRANAVGETSIEIAFERQRVARKATFQLGGPSSIPNETGAELGEARIFRFEPSRIAGAVDGLAPERMLPDGSNTARILGSWMLGRDPRFDEVVARLRAVVPHVTGIRVREPRVLHLDGALPTAPTPGDHFRATWVAGRQIHYDFTHAADLVANLASEGTLVATALLTALSERRESGLILVDDIDRALHPLAQKELIRQLRALLADVPNLQLLATTHSPDLLDVLESDEVTVFAADAGGEVFARRLSDHPDAEAMRGILRSGELWTHRREDWVLEGNAAAP